MTSSRKPTPASPIDAYKQIIDDLVEQTPSRSGRLIVEDGIYSKGQGDFGAEMNAFVASLSVKQRECLSRMLTSERQAGIGEVV